MSNVKWTKDQQKVINLRNKNILVSAAAGSGKTAVLVERILHLISEGEHPIDIDHLLVVTFTNAAAAEMRERIGSAIEDKIQRYPDNMHLQKQMTLLHNAQITTIHSFCLNLIRNHFNVIDLDPGFRMGDEAELKLLKSDVLEEVLEEKYTQGEEDFLVFMESYATGKSDIIIENMVLKLHEFSISYPWPEEWLLEQKETFSSQSLFDIDKLESTKWMKTLLSYLEKVFQDLLERNQEAIDLCNEPDGPYPYLDTIEKDRKQLLYLSRQHTYQEYSTILENVSFSRLSAKRDEAISIEKRETVKVIREEMKKTIMDIRKNYFFQPLNEMLEDIVKAGQAMAALIDLTIEFSKAFAKEKEEKNLLDFSDLEHFALQILIKKEEKEEIPSRIAIDLSEYYKEILIDEYQDSNLVQEKILNSITKEKFGKPNFFMVGDVKQSIYKFRLARPELFMEKYNTYSIEDSSYQRVNLHQNFRSREVVLDCVNLIFEQIMTKRLGEIEYNKEAALYKGALYPEGEETVSDSTELLLISGKPLNQKESLTEDMTEEEEDYTEKELEAKIIAKKIKEIINPQTGLFILESGKLRLAEYKDIVVLLRTMSEWAEVFTDVFMEEKIPAYSDTRSGYFETLEVTTILNMLKIIDNPRQDISLASILTSPIVGLEDEEMAIIRIADKKGDFYDAILAFLEKEPIELPQIEDNWKEKQDKIKQKLESFLDLLEEFRYMVTYMPIHEVLEQVLERTGYLYYVSAMPVGQRRSANLKMLLQKAVDFEATSYRGLFQFIRYIEKLHKYEIDFGEAGAGNENEKAVRIMSIHKSKGLEFPIVFAAGMGKTFNTMDTKSRLVFHPDLGLGPDYVDYRLRIKAPTLIKKILQKQLALENLAEELRILYVALTRAKEKLIITGRVKDIQKQLTKWNDTLSYQKLSNAGCYLDYIVPAFIGHKAFSPILRQFSMERHFENHYYNHPAKLKITIEDITNVIEREIGEKIEQQTKKEKLLSWDTEVVFNREIEEKIEYILNYKYFYEQETALHVKLTVSELKKEAQIDLEREEQDLGISLIEQAQEAYVPKFMKEETTVSSIDRGMLYHKILENIDLEKADTQKGIKEELDSMQQKGILEKQDIQQITIGKILNFTKSSLAQRMKKAQQEKRLYKERPFVIGIPANQIRKEYESDELILVQGVIDAYFEEEDGIVLIDYKTDWVKENDKQFLIERYQTQLDYYEKALTTITKKQVKEKYIYSLALNCEIKL